MNQNEKEKSIFGVAATRAITSYIIFVYARHAFVSSNMRRYVRDKLSRYKNNHVGIRYRSMIIRCITSRLDQCNRRIIKLPARDARTNWSLHCLSVFSKISRLNVRNSSYSYAPKNLDFLEPDNRRKDLGTRLVEFEHFDFSSSDDGYFSYYFSCTKR